MLVYNDCVVVIKILMTLITTRSKHQVGNGGNDLSKSALVIGGGIAGIQSSLDLADRGSHKGQKFFVFKPGSFHCPFCHFLFCQGFLWLNQIHSGKN